MTAQSPSALWYATRGSGYTALVLLTASVVLGVLTARRWHSPEWPRFLVQAIHRSVSLLVLVFLALHIVTAVLDPYAGLGLHDALVPFSSSYRAFWLGLGVIAMELLVALVVTSLVRHRLGFRAWKAIHWLAYASWPLALVHGLGTGTDAASGWGLLLDLGCVLAVGYAVAWRLSEGWPSRAGLRVALGTLGTVGLVVVAAWTVNGPLRPGWARAAGTPTRLLAGGAATATPTASPAAAGGLAAGIDDQLQGTAPQDDGTTLHVRLTDLADPGLTLTLSVPDNSSSAASLQISRGGAVVCTAPATLGDSVTASCGTTAVRLNLTQGRRGTLDGELVTQAASS